MSLASSPLGSALGFRRVFTSEDVDVYDMFDWQRRDAMIHDWRTGEVAFEQHGIEVPTNWSINASNILAQKYFRGTLDTPERETSLRQVADRVVDTITEWGVEGGYFADEAEAVVFSDELKFLIVSQRLAFNSPVWFNIGVQGVPQQASACFILSVEDTMESILNWYAEEGMIFKGGSGAGVNLSRIRSSMEKLNGGGTPSGPVSFMRGADASAGTIKSGGKTRRAAKMVMLDVDHPDVEEFIWCKAKEEKKARALRDAGFDMDLDGADSFSIQYQNANNSVRVSDEFMNAVVDGDDWNLIAVSTGEVVKTVPARELMGEIAQAAWECADPGVQFDTTINKWHTTPSAGRINGSNPCAEYVHLENSACNLASLNLLAFHRPEETGDFFQIDEFVAATELVFTAQEILVGRADYPTEKIGENTRRFRQIGLGYANLGALLMAAGAPYDSDRGRALAGAVTALMGGSAYNMSTRLAARVGAFEGYDDDAANVERVLGMHRAAVGEIDPSLVPIDLLSAAHAAWDDTCVRATEHGVRNAQATVLAPTGCLVGGSLISTSRGLVRLRSLGDPEGETWQRLDVDVMTDEGVRPASKFFVNGLSPVVDVRTRRGYRITGTPEHRIRVVDDENNWVWRRFGEILAGDLVPLALGSMLGEEQEVGLPPLSEKTAWAGEWHVSVPRTMTPDLAELIGYFMGDGSLHSRGLRLCMSDLDVADHFLRVAKELFGIDGKLTAKTGYTELALHSTRLVEWWEASGFAKLPPFVGHQGKGYVPRIPDAVLHSNSASVYRAFLRGLFEADGTVSVGYPSVTSAKSSFSDEVQTLLLCLGFPTTVHKGLSGRGSTLYVLRLLNRRLNGRWLDEIGFISRRKYESVDVGDCPQASRYDHIPVDRSLIDRVAPVNGRLRRNALLSLRRHGGISRSLAMELLETNHDEELSFRLGFFFDRVEEASLDREEFTFDISVPENVTYLANGFLSHNTISFLMDCDTTGIEPDLGLVKMKKLVGGGTMQIVNQGVGRALMQLGYSPEDVEAIVAHVAETGSVIGAPGIADEHVAVFACSMGDNVISARGHIAMMAAVQPFLSGAISKTVNIPESITVEEFQDILIESWQLGLKSVALYRDNCKVAQPLTAKSSADANDENGPSQLAGTVAPSPQRERLPRSRSSRTFEFRVSDCKGFVTVGEYDDGRPGELFIRVSKQGSTLAGIMDAFAISVSHGLQYGVPLAAFVDAFVGMRFEPAGMTDDADLRIASSLMDYLFRRLAVEYMTLEERQKRNILTTGERSQPTLPGVAEAVEPSIRGIDIPSDPPSGHLSESSLDAPEDAHEATSDAPFCGQCGTQMVRAGSCHACRDCGSTSGCS